MRKITSSVSPARTLPDGACVLQFLAALWLWLEAALRWFGPVFLWALGVAAAAWWGVFAKLSGAWASAVPIGFWLGASALLIKDFRTVPWPNRERVQMRLEQAGALHHQPLQTLNDNPIRRNALTDALWQHHQLRAARRLESLRWPKLRAEYAARDPMAVRWLALLLTLLGVLHAPSFAWPRAAAAFIPAPQAVWAAIGPGAFHVYLTPPAYTGIAPMYFSSANALPEKLTLPVGTEMWASVSGGAVKPTFDTGAGSRKLSRVQDGFFELQDTLTAATRIELRQGWIPLVDLPVVLQPDAPPAISIQMVTSPAPGQLQVNLCAQDRYALRDAALHWQGRAEPDFQGEKIIPTTDKNFCTPVVTDVAADPLAGQKVLLWASAKNSAGLEAETEKQILTFPQQTFHRPWAARLADARQRYALNPDPAARDALKQTLFELQRTQLPLNVYLSVANARRRLAAGRADSAFFSGLWQIAGRLEEGAAADAAANWREEQRTLTGALADWRVPEDAVLKRMAAAEEAWRAYAAARGQDTGGTEKTWPGMAAQIASGARGDAAQTLEQMDENPAAVIAVQPGTAEINPAAADALRFIRARLAEPDLPDSERDYLEKLIQP